MTIASPVMTMDETAIIHLGAINSHQVSGSVILALQCIQAQLDIILASDDENKEAIGALLIQQLIKRGAVVGHKEQTDLHNRMSSYGSSQRKNTDLFKHPATSPEEQTEPNNNAPKI